jgi:GT2 family glycosyltransferase
VATENKLSARSDALPFASVIIPHYNDLDALAECLGRLRKQTYPRDRFEIIIADNNSRCGLEVIREMAPDAEVLLAPIQGAGPARNAGAAIAKGAIFAFIDSDCLAENSWLMHGVDGLRGYDFIGGQVRTTCRDAKRPTPVEAFEMVFAFDFKRYVEKVGFTGTGNMFTRREVFEAVGPFRAHVSEDMEWSFRAREKGFRIGYVDTAIVAHPGRYTWAELVHRWRRMTLESRLFDQERGYREIHFWSRALLLPISIVPHAGRVLVSPRLPDIRARIGALSVLIGIRGWRATEEIRLTLFGTEQKPNPHELR